MRVLRYAAYLWPGLPQLWFEGAWSGLALALGFGVLLNGLLLASLVWVELITSAVRLVAWVALAVIWAGSGLFVAWSGGLRDSAAARQARDDLFRGALGEYLKGAWFEAETLLGELLAEDSRDVDARLMLASLLRHTRRPLEARRQLDELCRLEKAEKWRLEIDRERQLLLAVTPAGDEPASDPPAGQDPSADESTADPVILPLARAA